ncbi:MAG: AMP-binding protein, partial [Chloroflexales bacterium]|nr:AMP-binding protein [Chloroflexales bacterium]
MQPIHPAVRRMRHDATADPEAFWGRAAAQLPWLRPWDRVFEHEYPTFRWFVGGQTNLAYNALDHHIQRGWGGHVALIAFNERGARRVLSYAMLLHEVERAAAALRGMGIAKGDRITIYMPTCAEAIILMLATVRIGAIHSVVFAGFGAGALADRINASGSRLVFTADITYRKGKDVPIKGLVDSALDLVCPTVEAVVVLKRGSDAPFKDGRDIAWDAFRARGEGHDSGYIALESNEPVFILATSGTTTKPKLAVHKHGGYQVQIHSMASWMFGLRETDVWWSMSDIG